MNGKTNSDLSIPQILFRKKREKAIDKDNNLENRKEIMQVKKIRYHGYIFVDSIYKSFMK